MSTPQQTVEIGDYKYGFAYPEKSIFKTQKGLNEEVVRAISKHKNEPKWMLEYRLKSIETFLKRPMPNWGADLSDLNFDGVKVNDDNTVALSRWRGVDLVDGDNRFKAEVVDASGTIVWKSERVAHYGGGPVPARV